MHFVKILCFRKGTDLSNEVLWILGAEGAAKLPDLKKGLDLKKIIARQAYGPQSFNKTGIAKMSLFSNLKL